MEMYHLFLNYVNNIKFLWNWKKSPIISRTRTAEVFNIGSYWKHLPNSIRRWEVGLQDMYVCICVYVCLFVCLPSGCRVCGHTDSRNRIFRHESPDRFRHLCHSKAGSQWGPCPMWAGPSVGGALPAQGLGTWQGMHVLKQGWGCGPSASH